MQLMINKSLIISSSCKDLRNVGYSVNFFQLEIFALDKKTNEMKRTFRSSWVTNLALSKSNISRITAAARARLQN